MNTAIIVAAGSGTRFNSEIPKQFHEINGQSVLAHTIEKFEAAPSVHCIVLVLASDLAASFDDSAYGKIIHVVPGGSTRARSVCNGLEMVPLDTEIVVVHDGARPLITVDEIERTIAKAKETGAACLVAQVTDTIKSVSGEEIADTLDRSKLRRALTPQAFRTELLKKAFEDSDLNLDVNESITDECYLVEKLGHPIAIVEGNSRNIKITTQDDLEIVNAFLKK